MSNQSTPQKPANVPADAFWEDESWTAGPRDAAGRRVGTWTSWRANGELECIDEFGDGTQRLTYRRFHPDGSESQRGAKDLVKDAWVGLMRWTRAAGPSPEDRYWDASLGEAVHAIERDLDDGYIVTQRTFDAQGHPVASDGQPLPPRPENVPAEAYYEPSGRVWLLEQRALANGALRGERRVWDRNGALCERSLHEPANAPREQDTYQDGRLWMSKRWLAGGDMVQSFYHRRSDPPAVRSATLYRNAQKDRTTTFFDAQGQKLYSVRMEVVGLHHVRRYYDDRLVFEAIAPADPNQPPSKVEYYDLAGALLVSYASMGDGAGVWTLHDATGAAELTLPESDERSRNEYDNWSCFLPGFARYDQTTTEDDPSVVRAAFREAHEEEVTAAALARLESSPELVAALGPGSWARVETAYGGGKELPLHVKGVLADDPAIASYALDHIWPEIEHQGSVYPATYRVATALATMLPLQAARPAVERRVVDFLIEVLRLPQITADGKAYEAWMTAMRPSIPRFAAFAADADESLARAGLFLLAHAGRGQRAAIDLFARRLQEGATPVERARAAFGLSMTATAKESRAAFERAFTAADDPMLRCVLALLLLVRAQRPEKEWIAAIEPYTIDGSPIEASVAELAPFFTGDVAATVRAHVPDEVLARHMDALMAVMREQDPLSQVESFEVLFRVLFSNGAPEQPSEVQRRALRACADVVDSNPNFVNHAEVFHQFDLPHDSFDLRQLAEREAPPSAKRSSAKKATKKSGTKKAATKKATKKSGAKKATKKAAATKSGTKKPGAKKATTKSGTKKPGVKSATKKSGAKKSAMKAGAKQAGAKKPGAKKVTKKPGTKGRAKRAPK
ncbi:hypothetical protein [Nannocystis sp. SCPEA4]|uniref:hypothetical protein n=1 Tax=Nannocystis sp. SCPEA4 TaxID=2996787 RepID=UPI00226EB794|nr:hypothetical protein [Nannocystis sp. SCPEA4]MCY1055026.1 hypothetical protein [Nannocystis sp. SCPEA4]